jgi:hypothetical protein
MDLRNTWWMAAIIGALVAILVLSLIIHPICSIIILIVLIIIASEFGFDIGIDVLSDLIGSGPDTRIYENGLVLISTFGRQHFYAWDRFEGWEYYPAAPDNRYFSWEMVLYYKARVRASDPDRIPIGQGIDNPQLAWNHIMQRVPRYMRRT